MPTVAGHNITDRQLVALHGLYRGLVKGNRTVYGVDVRRALDALADKGVIDRTGMGAYMIPYGSPGAAIIDASPDFAIGAYI
jgi:hypothetical protein